MKDPKQQKTLEWWFSVIYEPILMKFISRDRDFIPDSNGARREKMQPEGAEI